MFPLLLQLKTPLLLSLGSGESGKVLAALFLMLVSAKLMAELCERLGQPAAIGEILAGVIIGPSLLNWVQPSDITGALAEIGVVFLLFSVGLETHPSQIFKVGGTAALVAVLGVTISFIAGWALLSVWPGHSRTEAIFLGVSMVATSVGISARVLSGMGVISSAASRVVLAAAVIDDLIGLVVLAVFSRMANGHGNYLDIGLTACLAISFTISMAVLGTHAVRRVRRPVTDLRINHSLLVFALLLCFGLAAVANLIGIAGIVGAFLAGVALSETTENTDLHHQAQTLTEFAVPFFLVTIGMQVDLRIFLSPSAVALAAVVSALAIAAKLVGCGLASARMGRRRAFQIGVGMIPRGEVSVIVAQLGLATGAIGATIYAVVLIMVVATTLIAPVFIKPAFKNERVSSTPEPCLDLSGVSQFIEA